MKKLFLSFGIMFIALTAMSTSAHGFGEENIYQRVYEDLQTSPEQKTSEVLALQFGVDIADIRTLRTSLPKIQDLAKLSFCTDLEASQESVFVCAQRFQELFASTELLAEYEYVLTEENAARNIWSNETLADSTFDIIVDLNILDVLLFGPNASVSAPRIAGTYHDGRSRRYADVVNGLSNRGPFDTESPPEEPPAGDGDGDGGGDGDGDGDFSDNVCQDPDALFLTYFNNSTSQDNIFSSGGGSATGSSGILPDLAGEKSDFLRGAYPEYESKDPNDACGEDERAVPLFNGMHCVPNFCEDLLCVFTEVIPGRGFSLAPVETPACIECMIERGYEVLSTLDQIVESPQKASNENYAIRKFSALFGKIGMDFHAIPKQVPFLDYSDAQEETPPMDTDKKVDEQANQSPEDEESSNYKTAIKIFNTDCSILSKLSPEAVTLQEEVFDFCAAYDDEVASESIQKILTSTAGDPSDIERYLNLEEHLEFAREIEFELQRLKNDFRDFYAQIPDLTEKMNDMQTCSL